MFIYPYVNIVKWRYSTSRTSYTACQYTKIASLDWKIIIYRTNIIILYCHWTRPWKQDQL